jgi:hypothetical protein
LANFRNLLLAVAGIAVSTMAIEVFCLWERSCSVYDHFYYETVSTRWPDGREQGGFPNELAGKQWKPGEPMLIERDWDIVARGGGIRVEYRYCNTDLTRLDSSQFGEYFNGPSSLAKLGNRIGPPDPAYGHEVLEGTYGYPTFGFLEYPRTWDFRHTVGYEPMAPLDYYHKIGVIFPYWSLAILSSLPAVLIWIKLLTRFRRVAAGYCQKCGYDLRATRDRCSECGTPILSNAPTKPAIK